MLRTANELLPPLIDSLLSSPVDSSSTSTSCFDNPTPSSEATLLSALVLNCQSLVASS